MKTYTIDEIEFKVDFSDRWITIYQAAPINQVLQIETIESSEELNNQYVLIPLPDKIYCLYFNVNGEGFGGNYAQKFSEIEIPINSTASASEVAQAIQNALDPTEFELERNDNILLITNKKAGKTMVPNTNTGFNMEVLITGQDANSIVKQGFPHKNNFFSGINLERIDDVTIEGIFDESNLVGLDVIVSGLYKEFGRDRDQHNEWYGYANYFNDVVHYPDWV